jgi:hypothetical protein
MRATTVSDDRVAVAAAGAGAALSPRFAVTGPMLAPMPSPIANVAVASRRPALPWLADNSLGQRIIISDKMQSKGELIFIARPGLRQKSDVKPFFSQSP